MATPRKHWFKVADSIADEDWPNDVLATLIRLAARMNTRRARNGLSYAEASSIVLTASDMMSVTRRSRRTLAARVLHACCTHVTAVLQPCGTACIFSWPKWAEFQDSASRELPESRPRVARSGSVLRTPTPESEDLCLSKTRDIEPAIAGSVPRLVNLLSREEGSLEEKSAWAIEYEPILIAESEAEHPRDARARSAKLRSLTLRYWRAHRRRNGMSKEPDALARWAERTS